MAWAEEPLSFYIGNGERVMRAILVGAERPLHMQGSVISEELVCQPNLVEYFLAGSIVGDIQLIAISTDRRSPLGRWFGEDAAGASKWALTQNGLGHGVYWTVNSATPNLHKKPSKAQIVAARLLHVDIDPAADGSFDRAGVLHKLANFEAPPAFVIDSGGGLQAFWRLAQPTDDFKKVEAVNQALADVFEGDNCHNIDRLMRVPGTINFPNSIKLKRGREPKLAKLVVQDEGASVDLDNMVRIIQRFSDNALLLHQGSAAPRKTPAIIEGGHIALTTHKIRADRELWSVIMDRDDGRRSERVLCVAGMMVRRGYSDEDIAKILTDRSLPISGHCYDQTDPVRAAERAIKKARTASGAASDKSNSRSPAGKRGRTGPNQVSEDDIARAFTAMHQGNLLFDFHRRRWFHWNGNNWKMDETDLALDFARQLARKLGQGSTSAGRYSTASGVEKLARCDRTHAVTSDAWDIDPLLLGTPAGTVDLRSGTINKAKAEDRITRQTAVGPASGKPVRWLAFLDEALAGDQEVIDFLQEWAGYCLTGLTSAHALVFLFGPGLNGKSVFVNALLSIAGTYAQVASMDTFTASKYDRHSTELAMLHGARLVTASETEADRSWAEAKIKALTGGDPITARFMAKDNFTFKPQFKLTIAGNHTPALQNVDDAMRRRFNIVPFVQKPAKPDPALEQKLVEEYPQILAWMIAGCSRFLEQGLSRPAAIRIATDEYFSDQDVFGHWLNDRCDVRAGLSAAAASLYADWTLFAKTAGEDPGSAKLFGSKMKRHGFASKNVRHPGKVQRTYAGLELVKSNSDPNKV